MRRWYGLFGLCALCALAVTIVQAKDSASNKQKAESTESPTKQTASKTGKKVATARERTLFRHASLSGAWRAAKKSNRRILLYATMDHCHYCKKMQTHTLAQQRVRSLMRNDFEPVRIDRSQQPKLVKQLGIRIYPTTIIANADGKIVDRIEGYVPAKSLVQRLEQPSQPVRAAKR